MSEQQDRKLCDNVVIAPVISDPFSDVRRLWRLDCSLTGTGMCFSSPTKGSQELVLLPWGKTDPSSPSTLAAGACWEKSRLVVFFPSRRSSLLS